MENEKLLQLLESTFGSNESLRARALNSDKELLEFLLKNENLKAKFFSHIADSFIFEKERFLEFLSLRVLNSSYTRFANKIGLASLESTKEKLLKADSKVVLNFPFKDCVLKGGAKDDAHKSKEVFLNDILASDEIDALFRPKALHNFVLVDRNIGGGGGANALKSALENKPNLLIKGNNLIALHTLKHRKDIYGQVKLIYIDPPYNTGNDSFNYNDNFNHSTWLTFMKNRLEIAREFLRDDGVIFVQCDDNEQAYLKVLMDEIFGRENFVSNIVWNSINSVLKQTRLIRKEHEYILCYAKNKDNVDFNKLENNMKFSNPDNDPNGAWFSSNAANPNQNEKNFFAIRLPNGDLCERSWKFSKEDYEKGLVNLYLKGGNVPRLKIYEKDYDRFSSVQGSILMELGSITSAKTEIKAIFSDTDSELFATPKPEALLKRIIEISTQEGDLVMDFFAGSGTTLAVAHKMKRRYVGIEQMGYIESITKERLKKVVDGEQGGISKAVGWNPAESSQDETKASKSEAKNEFIYLELMPLNLALKEKIQKASDKNALDSISQTLESSGFLDYRVGGVDLRDLEFGALDLEEQKRVLIECLDSNMDYVPYKDMQDSNYKIDDNTIALNDAFYNGGE